MYDELLKSDYPRITNHGDLLNGLSLTLEATYATPSPRIPSLFIAYTFSLFTIFTFVMELEPKDDERCCCSLEAKRPPSYSFTTPLR